MCKFSTVGAVYMQCFEFEKPVKAVWHDVTCTVKGKLDFVNVTKSVQNVNISACKKR